MLVSALRAAVPLHVLLTLLRLSLGLPDHRQGLFPPVCPSTLGPSSAPSLHWAQGLGTSSGTASR